MRQSKERISGDESDNRDAICATTWRRPSSHAQVDDDIDSAANIFLTALNDTDWRRTVESLLQADLLDELRLEIDPVVAGTGARFFGEGRASKHLQLATSKITGNGVAILTYRPVRS